MNRPAPTAENPPPTNIPRFHKFVLFAGSLAYIGFVPTASGTVAVALVGVPLFYLMHQLHWAVYSSVFVILFFGAVWLSQAGDRILGEKDSSKMVIDEIVGYMVAVFTLRWSWPIALLSFLLERAIDIAKIPPANMIEKKVPGGWGVVLDDVMAGVYTLIIVRLLLFVRPEWFD